MSEQLSFVRSLLLFVLAGLCEIGWRLVDLAMVAGRQAILVGIGWRRCVDSLRYYSHTLAWRCALEAESP